MFGVLFAAPQYFHAILGADAQGSGFRLLPIIAGFVVGAILAERMGSGSAPARGCLGFAVLAGGLFTGATTTVTSGDWFLLTWTSMAGAGMGLALGHGG